MGRAPASHHRTHPGKADLDVTTRTQDNLARNAGYRDRIRATNGAIVSSARLTETPLPITTNP